MAVLGKAVMIVIRWKNNDDKIDNKSSSNFESSSGKEKSYPPRIVRVRIAFDSLKKNMNRQQILEADPI